MADNTITTSRKSCKPDCNQLNIIDRTIIQNKYSDIDEYTSTDTEEPTSTTTRYSQPEDMSATSTNDLPLNITKMIQNKLKRKKKLSTSLTSVGDTVNQEKRTRIEGIQLNCRGKLNSDLIAAAKSAPTTPTQQPASLQIRAERAHSRTPAPSPRVAEKIIMLQQKQQQSQSPTPQQQQQQQQKVPPPRLKRKLEENVLTIQKLNAQTDQMRLEIAELKAHLGTEKGAVRVLRAQNESESRKWKNEIKKLQNAMELMRKVKKSKDEACANWTSSNHHSTAASSSLATTSSSAKDVNQMNHELQRLTNEITSLKDANRNLEEKLQMSNDAERRKVADLRELKDSYEIRLTQLSKSAKTEISRLLEEIKTKERNIGQLKKETLTLQKPKTNKTTNHNNNNNNTTKKDINPKNATQHPTEMKKLKDIERNKNNINLNCNVTNKTKTNNDKCFITTTCGDKEFHSMPHEFTERILEAHNDVHVYRSKDHHQNSDSDSALSSAPPSISPQPPANGMEPADIWQTIRNYTKDIEKVQNDLESIQKENQTLQHELNLAKEQIFESEKTAIEATNNLKNQQKLLERIKQLEQKEIELQDETHELREQNELLEFRILELEESNDKWSLQSNTTPNSKNVWNNVGGKESDEAIIFTDRSDSGVTSPHSHHHIDDRINVISPCDLNLLDHMTNEDLRRRLSQILKKPNIDEEDKMCLQQVLAFVQNLDAMSHGHDSLPSSEESSSLEYIKSRVSDYSSSSRSSDISPTLQLQKPKSSPTSQGRIVATVLPYSSAVSTPNESPQRKLRAWHTTSLTESGVFEGDLSETSVYTQTEPEDFSNSESTEAQKLNRIREQFEECAKKSAYAKVPVTSSQSLSPNFSDQKRIQYYKERLEVLEGKLLIYESSGDIQAKRLADRLQREIILENLVKELQDRVDFLEVENSEIEEEKCEFEEAENDTRLRLQRLEVELEILSQRNIELEMSREALQNKLKDCRSESAILRDDLSAVQTQVCHLEEDRCRFKDNFEFLHSVLPALALFNAFCLANDKMGNCIEREVSEPEVTRHDGIGRMDNSCDSLDAEDILRREIANLRGEIRILKRQINDLNSRHSEALACADGCWEDLEKSYNDRLMASKSKEESLQKKIKQLEDCLQDDARVANEKICQLEDVERELRMCLQKVTRDQRKTLQERGLITEEYHRLKEKYEKLVQQFDGPIKDALDREKTQNKNLKDELGYIRRINCEQDMHYRNEIDCFQVQLEKLQKELLQIQVTNSELKEEVCTLEQQVVSLHQLRKEDLDKIRCLSDEVRTKEEMCDMLEKRVEKLMCGSYYRQRVDCQMSASFSGAVSLAQELNGSPVKRIKIEEPVDLKTATKNLGTVLGNMKIDQEHPKMIVTEITQI
ncbi:restin homolog isoform X2 [Eupeodes corollae]|uniref:restin homolog isoform X2 n=1 Tax=Eupeodes corollae TaxID=290404 RepID=UPI00249269D0|nr:restin homolog isoform X2 [Eupeodes corollae]